MGSSRGAVGQVREGLAALLAADVADLPVGVCGAEVLELERLIAGLRAAQAQRLARFDAHAGHEAECAATTAGWLRRELHLDAGDAGRLVAAARALRDLPAAAGALAGGAITSGHVRVIARAVARVGVDVVAEAEPVLLGLAVAAPPAQVQHA